MILTEAFAVGTPVVASAIAGYRDVVRDGVDGVLFERGDASALAHTLFELAGDAAAPGDVGCGGRARAPLRLAAGGRGGARRLRGRDRHAAPARAAHATAPSRSALRSADRGPPRRAAAAREPRARPAQPPRARARGRASRRDRARHARRRRRSRGGRRREDRARTDRERAGDLAAVVGRDRLRPDVRGDGRARRRLARDPARRAAAGRRATRGCDARHLHRRADERDVAGPARRAVALADRRAPRRAPPRDLPDRARHGRLADAAEPRRAGRARRRDVHERRPLQRPPFGADRRRRRPGGVGGVDPCGAAPARPPRRAVALHAARTAARARAQALVRMRAGMRVFREPRLGAAGAGSSAPGRCSAPPATCS